MTAFTGSPVSSPGAVKQVMPGGIKIVGPHDVSFFITELYTHLAAQGTGTGTVVLGYLPAGDYWVFPHLSVLVTSAFESAADAHIGYPAFTKRDGTTETADDNAFFDNVDVATGGVFTSALGPFRVQAADPVPINMLIDTGDIAADDTAQLFVAIAKL